MYCHTKSRQQRKPSAIKIHYYKIDCRGYRSKLLTAQFNTEAAAKKWWADMGRVAAQNGTTLHRVSTPRRGEIEYR